MKILLVLSEFPTNLDKVKGGVHSAVLNLLRGLAEHNITVDVLSFNKQLKKSFTCKFTDKIEINYMNEGPFPFHSFNFLFATPYLLKRMVRIKNPDLIHFQMGGFFLFGRYFLNKKIPQLLSIHGIPAGKAKIVTSIKEKIKLRIIQFADLFFLPDNLIHLSQYSLNMYNVANNKRYKIIPNPVDSFFFDIKPKNETSNHLLFIGVLDANKNLLFLLKRISKLNSLGYHFKVSVVGGFRDLKYKSVIDTYIMNNNLSNFVFFEGWRTRKQVADLLATSDILVLSSMQDSFPMVVAEAMAASKVVIASRVGGVSEMFSDKNSGFLFNLDCPAEFDEILKTLYNNNELTVKVSRNAREFAITKYRYNIVADKTVSYYLDLML